MRSETAFRDLMLVAGIIAIAVIVAMAWNGNVSAPSERQPQPTEGPGIDIRLPGSGGEGGGSGGVWINLQGLWDRLVNFFLQLRLRLLTEIQI